MLVKDVIAGIQSKELSIKGLAEQYSVSDRTVQGKIKGMGFKWNPKQAMYEFMGEDATVFEQDFTSLFNNTSTSNSRSNNRSETKSKSTSINKSESTSPSEINVTSNSTVEQEDEPDIIDILLAGDKAKSKRVYRGFYFDKDVLDIVDKAGNKSELINQALRKVFKDKGLL